MKIDLADASRVKAAILALGGDLQKATESAQNAMIYKVFASEKDQMQIDIDRPTPWSIGALRYKKVGAPKGDEPATQDAIVYMADPFRKGEYTGAQEYLGVQTLGGITAGPRRSEKRLQMLGWMPRGKVWVPASGVPLNQYGNINGGKIGGMLINLGAIPRNGKNKAKATFVLVGPPGNEEGVFWKVNGEWKPFIWFINPPTYSKRYRFYDNAGATISAEYPAILQQYIDIAMDRLR